MIFESVVSWICFVCFCSNLLHTLHMLGYMSMTIYFTIGSKMADWQPSCFLKMCGILDMLCQFSFRVATYIIHVRTHVHDNLFRDQIKDGRLAAILFFEKCVVSWTCFVSFRSDLVHVYIIHIRIHVHDYLFHNWIKDGRLVAILIFENVWYLGHVLSVFFQIWYIHYRC